MNLETLYVDYKGNIITYSTNINIRKYFYVTESLRSVILEITDHNIGLEISNLNNVYLALSIEGMHDLITLKSCIKVGEYFFKEYSLITFLGELE